MPSHPQNVDHLRERLRALGYLNAPVDRYVLGAATGRAGIVRFATVAGVRVGIVAGVLLGISAALALAVRAPGFVSSRRDALVLALALSVLFALVTAAAVAATAIGASWFAHRSRALTERRARMIAAAAGIAVALACAGYLTLWWNTARDLFTGLTSWWNLGALALTAVVALLLAHAASVVILAALARSASTAPIAAGGLLSSRGFLIAFGAVLFAGSAILLATEAGGGAREAAGSIAVAPTGYSLRVVAVDGFDLEVAHRLRAGGRLPALARLFEGASVPLRPGAEAAPDPARDWTTIATGRPPAVHGIASLEARRALGIGGRLPAAAEGALRPLLYAADLLRLTAPAIASGQERRVPAFWEVAAAAGLRTAVVNWWATWPAADGDDVVITDRAVLRLDTGGSLDAELSPASLYESLRGRWTDMRAQAAARAAQRFDAIGDPALRAVILRSAELDLLIAALAQADSGPPVDLRVIYLPGLDIAQHNLLQAQSPTTVSAMGERVKAIERYYEFLDAITGELLPASNTHIDAVMLWAGRAGPREGRMVLAGPPIQPGRDGCARCEEGAAAAILLYLLGLPVADDLNADGVGDVVSDAFSRRHAVRRIDSYDAIAVRKPAQRGQPLDAEALERLRSLGYIR